MNARVVTRESHRDSPPLSRVKSHDLPPTPSKPSVVQVRTDLSHHLKTNFSPSSTSNVRYARAKTDDADDEH